MMKTKYVIILIVLPVLLCALFITTVRVINKTKLQFVENINKTYSFPNKHVFYSLQSVEEGTVVYLVCDKDVYYSCKLEQIKYPYTSTTHSCNITLAVDGIIHRPYVLLVPFGENRTILFWEDSKTQEGTGTSVRISVIHLNRCRKTKDFILHDSRSTFDESPSLVLQQLSLQRKIVTYNDTFDIFFKDSERCGDAECKLTISDEGKAVTPLVKFMNNTGYDVVEIYSIALHSSTKGYVYTKYNSSGDDAGLFSMRPNGSEKRLATIGKWNRISIVNQTIGVCSRPSDTFVYSNITCLNYDADGNLKLNISYSPILSPHTNTSIIHPHSMNLYSLPGGGFLLQMFEFIKCQNKSDCWKILPTLGYYIVQVDETGKEIGKVYFEEYQDLYKINEVRNIWRNEDKDSYCALMLKSQKELDRLNVAATCFTSKIFSS